MSRMSITPRAMKQVALLVAASLIVAACGAPASPTTTQPAATTAAQPAAQGTEAATAAAAPAASGDEKYQLTFLDGCFPASQAVTQVMLAAFGAKHPNIDVKVDCNVGDYAENIFAKAAAGNLPDVMMSADLFTVPFVNAGVLRDLSQYDKLEKTSTIDDIYPNILALGQLPGKPGTYMIPASFDSVQMYYNKTMFEKSGAKMPQDNWTWDDLIQACKTIQQKNSGVSCLALGGKDSWDWWAYFIPWIVGYGGKPVSDDFKQSTFSSPDSLAGIQAYVDLWTKHKVASPLGTELPGGGGDACFMSQKCAVFFHIPGFMKTFREKIKDFDWDVALMPTHPKKQVTGMGTFGYGVSKDSKHPEAAWELIKFLASPPGQRLVLQGYIGVPFLKSMANDPAFERMQPPPKNIKAFIKGGEIGIFPPNGYPPKCGSLYAGLINSTIRSALEQAIRAKSTVEAAFKDADAQIQSCLDTAQ